MFQVHEGTSFMRHLMREYILLEGVMYHVIIYIYNDTKNAIIR